MTARLGAWCGLAGVAGNVIGVIALGPIPSAYRPGPITSWAREVFAAPQAASLSAVAFALGLAALAGWAIVVAHRVRTPAAWAAGGLIAVGAALNAAGTLAPLVVALHLPKACASIDVCLPAAVALLGFSLSLDALFNLWLGLGLIAMGWTVARERPTLKAGAILMIVAGAASLPVSLQVASDTAARWLVVAGPLWLSAILWTSLSLWRNRL